MKNLPDLNRVNDKILKVKQLLLELEIEATQFPALSRNSKRALASIKMLELNISDIITFDLADF
ncbi:MAG: hypothetical protein KKE44_11150 [Proteobacteria bacterium]|nr:hypothetical protein [Pseudomonadota bacterium]MBU1583279.1 hypothetical protein [Pseudomonadota bacterium]MBU2453967.1 hypothetical protein [Pseudomonadota bacterium]MBU2631668.1 hypothetical protein [Pseudomonadota bacterium]